MTWYAAGFQARPFGNRPRKWKVELDDGVRRVSTLVFVKDIRIGHTFVMLAALVSVRCLTPRVMECYAP